MKLFDDIQRDYHGPALHTEPLFTFLNRSAQPRIEKIRQVLEDWFSRYPILEQSHFLGQFRNPINVHHNGAFFELFLHELLLQLGYKVLVIPRSQKKTPDFLVEAHDGSRFYLEATIATDESVEASKAQARMNIVYDALDRLSSPNFFIGMHLDGAPETPPPARQIRSFLQHRLATIDPDQVMEAFNAGGFDALPEWPYEHNGWKIRFFPVPKSIGLRGKKGIRPLALWMPMEARMINSSTAIKDAITTKAGRYGELDLPYVVAVNELGMFVDRNDIEQALFGTEQISLTMTSDSAGNHLHSYQPVRARDGVWTGQSRPNHTRVSAVLVTQRLAIWTAHTADICLYLNPWAEKPLPYVIRDVSVAMVEDSMVRYQEGRPLSSILNLSPDWLQDDHTDDG